MPKTPDAPGVITDAEPAKDVWQVLLATFIIRRSEILFMEGSADFKAKYSAFEIYILTVTGEIIAAGFAGVIVIFLFR